MGTDTCHVCGTDTKDSEGENIKVSWSLEQVVTLESDALPASEIALGTEELALSNNFSLR